MWIGHFAPAFLLRPHLPRTPLSLLVFATASADFLAFILSLVGVETFRYNKAKHGALPYDFLMPYTHSLLGMAVWGVLYAGLCVFLMKQRKINTPVDAGTPEASNTAVFLGTLMLVVSHWFLEIPVHRTLKDGVPFVPFGSLRFGWGGFENQVMSNLLELGLFLGAFAYYCLNTTTAAKGAGMRAWYETPTGFAACCIVSQLLVCGAPKWFYEHTPDKLMLCNGLLIMVVETWLAQKMDYKRRIKTAGPDPTAPAGGKLR